MARMLEFIPDEWFEERAHLSCARIADAVLEEFELIVQDNYVAREFRVRGITKIKAPNKLPDPSKKSEFEKNLERLSGAINGAPRGIRTAWSRGKKNVARRRLNPGR